MKYQQILEQPLLFLEQEQRELYYEQGYLVFPSLFKAEDLSPLKEAMYSIIEASRRITESSREIDLEKNHSAENPRLRRVAYIDDEYDVYRQLCEDSILADITADLLGPNVRYRELMLNFKWAKGGAEVKWHQDFVFYPHTHTGTLQFLLFLEEVTPEQGPLQIIPGSHKGPIFEHYNDQRNWTGAIKEADLQIAGVKNAIEITGGPGTVSVHHSCTIHGSGINYSTKGRPALVVTYSAADAMPYTAAAYPGSHYGIIVRGDEPRYAHHEELQVPMPPDWSAGYTSIYDHQERET